MAFEKWDPQPEFERFPASATIVQSRLIRLPTPVASMLRLRGKTNANLYYDKKRKVIGIRQADGDHCHIPLRIFTSRVGFGQILPNCASYRAAPQKSYHRSEDNANDDTGKRACKLWNGGKGEMGHQHECPQHQSKDHGEQDYSHRTGARARGL